MIGRGKPIFETCLPDRETGLSYRQCRAPTLNLPLVISSVVLAFLFSGVALYVIARWIQVSYATCLRAGYAVLTSQMLIQRRHGSVLVYIRKKRFDITYTGYAPFLAKHPLFHLRG